MWKNENQEKHRSWKQEHYNQEDINGKLLISLRDIGHTIRSLNEGRGSQKRILIILNELKGPVTQRELTERLGIQPGTASEIIAKLESAGLVARSSSESDRRTSNISLTNEGRHQAEEAKNQRIKRHKDMFFVLGEDEKTELLALLERINADWESRYADQHEGHGHPHGHCEGRAEHAGHPHHRWEKPEEHMGHPNASQEGGHSCNHDCANCEHPCHRSPKR